MRVNTIVYVFPEKLPLNAILLPLMAADDAISRLDERVCRFQRNAGLDFSD